ncbi:hypothetical protein IF1G_10953 [Cordyceps javanica]|uniref:Uncharacterized protein n=1 Tax=Cordyceps javanica TaxID=43265 RepID=A0A545VI23_9HYPO|nr:hypothetical protein IF1G_10953 [Cordyceps javanica]TQW01374.1 hypothetical protein IF2G_11107 [Cordyceps javanica]
MLLSGRWRTALSACTDPASAGPLPSTTITIRHIMLNRPQAREVGAGNLSLGFCIVLHVMSAARVRRVSLRLYAAPFICAKKLPRLSSRPLHHRRPQLDHYRSPPPPRRASATTSSRYSRARLVSFVLPNFAPCEDRH